MAEFTSTIVTRFEVEAENQNQQLGEVSSKLEKVGKQLEKSTDGFDKLRSAVDATGDRLRIFGKKGKAIADAIEDNIADPIERARLSMKHFRIMTSRTETGVGKFGKALGRFKVDVAVADQQFSEFGLSFARMGIAAAAAGAALVAFGVKSVGAFIAKNVEAKESTDGLTAAFTTLQEEVGGLIFQRAGLGGFFDDMSTGLRGVADEVREINRLMDAGEFMNAVRILTGINRAPSNSETILTGGGGSVTTTTTESKGMKPGSPEYIAFQARRQRESDRMEAAAQRELDGFASKPKGRGGRGGGGRAAARARERDARVGSLAALNSQKARSDARERSRLASLDGSAGIGAIARGNQTGAFGADMDAIKAKTAAALEGNTAKLSEFKRGLEAANAPTMSFFDALARGAEMAQSQFVGLGSAIGGALGTLAVGKSTIGDFGKSMLGVLGSIATQWGTFFLTAGTGFSFLPGGQGASPGMIAAGIGLTALGAGISALSAGSSGRSAGRGSSGGSAADIARDITRPRDDKPTETNIQVFVAADQIRDPIIRAVDESVRLGRSRYLQPQGAF
jgi:hypothetical protein